MKSKRNVVTDLCRKTERRTTRAVRTQAAPACYLSVHICDKDGMFLWMVFREPCQPLFDSHRLCISRGLLRGDRLVVDLYNCGEVIDLCEADQFLCPLVQGVFPSPDFGGFSSIL